MRLWQTLPPLSPNRRAPNRPFWEAKGHGLASVFLGAPRIFLGVKFSEMRELPPQKKMNKCLGVPSGFPPNRPKVGTGQQQKPDHPQNWSRRNKKTNTPDPRGVFFGLDLPAEVARCLGPRRAECHWPWVLRAFFMEAETPPKKQKTIGACLLGVDSKSILFSHPSFQQPHPFPKGLLGVF